MEKEKNTYIPPILTVVEFKTERGYADSVTRWDPVQQINMFVAAEADMTAGNDGSDGNMAAGYLGGTEDHSGDGGSSNWSYSNGSWF
jgi:hypothetical protein